MRMILRESYINVLNKNSEPGTIIADILLKNTIEKPDLTIHKFKINEILYTFKFRNTNNKVIKVITNPTTGLWTCEELNSLFQNHYSRIDFSTELLQQNIKQVAKILNQSIFWDKNMLNKDYFITYEEKQLINFVKDRNNSITNLLWWSKIKNRVSSQNNYDNTWWKVKVIVNKKLFEFIVTKDLIIEENHSNTPTWRIWDNIKWKKINQISDCDRNCFLQWL